jgi:hypothetical protein
MFRDNQGAIALTKNLYLYKRSKHINISYHFIRDLAKRKQLEIIYILTDKIVANRITKPLTRIAFKRFKRQLGVVKL